ncbi:hypothetical protein BDV33DRAFT_184416 [Aspergillus novoparasiticus]|uniref:Uncharacterized protein n=1 Tax=Aspergillus novoparasiticus TaxID=986946 RepID=A0A5N6E7Q1_9EURO|nr:hypothetical protein BDV33DRAFT_184416 [Aspergillus novoparasiticus]
MPCHRYSPSDHGSAPHQTPLVLHSQLCALGLVSFLSIIEHDSSYRSMCSGRRSPWPPKTKTLLRCIHRGLIAAPPSRHKMETFQPKKLVRLTRNFRNSNVSGCRSKQSSVCDGWAFPGWYHHPRHPVHWPCHPRN